MATRETFLQELKNLNQEVITMSQMVQDAIDSSFQALSEHNTELADKIIKGDRDVDNMERKIETHCLMLMLKQQPVASDLRHISTALKVVTDLERMGDQAADIADLSLRLEAADYGLVSKHLPAMVANVKTMVKVAIRAFIERDTETAETFEQRDDLIDAFFERVKREVIEFLKKDGDKSDVAVDVLMVAKYLERIADHAVKVCEWTEFSHRYKCRLPHLQSALPVSGHLPHHRYSPSRMMPLPRPLPLRKPDFLPLLCGRTRCLSYQSEPSQILLRAPEPAHRSR